MKLVAQIILWNSQAGLDLVFVILKSPDRFRWNQEHSNGEGLPAGSHTSGGEAIW